MKLDATVEAKVTRCAESWQFFAFVFAAFSGLGIAIIGELSLFPFRKGCWQIVWFFGCAYFFMRNAWVRNKLVGVLGWIKEE